jgi:hypothetical protein
MIFASCFVGITISSTFNLIINEKGKKQHTLSRLKFNLIYI